MSPGDSSHDPYAVVLGVAQDGGHPHPGCRRACCAAAFDDPSLGHRAACIGLVDPLSGEAWLFDATPDLPTQLDMLLGPPTSGLRLSGVFLTHAHIGHYTGLMYLGHEAMAARGVPVWAMPRMRKFLSENGPWEAIANAEHVSIRNLEAGTSVRLNSRLTVTPSPLPHRDEYSETVAFRITGPNRTCAYLPDIDSWDDWDIGLTDFLSETDRAWIDGTFYSAGELGGRDPALVPHPLVQETLRRVRTLPEDVRNALHFIHLNHTNPLLDSRSNATAEVLAAGVHVASRGDRFRL